VPQQTYNIQMAKSCGKPLQIQLITAAILSSDVGGQSSLLISPTPLVGGFLSPTLFFVLYNWKGKCL